MTSTPPQKYEIAIIGAGIAGPLLALTILNHPVLHTLYNPTIYEKLPPPLPLPSSSTSDAAYAAGAAVALTSNALYPLFQLGPEFRTELEQISAECKSIGIWRAWASGKGERWNRIVNPGWKSDLGTNLRVVERRFLQDLLLRWVVERGGRVVWGRKLVGVEEEEGEGEGEGGAVRISFEDGTVEKCGLLVGADGSWSQVRKHIITSQPELQGEKPAAERWKPGFSFADGIYGISKAVVGEGCDEGKPGDTECILLDSGTASTWALPDGKQFWTISVASAEPPPYPTSKERSDMYGAHINTGGYTAESTREILERYENVWHPVARTFGELFRNSERIVRSSLWHQAWEPNDVARGNVVVIGDASRVMVPSSGQGACFGIEDATVLAKYLLNRTPDEEGFGDVLSRFAEERAPRNKRMANQSYWTGLLTLGDRWYWRWLRDLGSRLMPMGGDPKQNAGGEARDPMGWLHDVRYDVEQVQDEAK